MISKRVKTLLSLLILSLVLIPRSLSRELEVYSNVEFHNLSELEQRVFLIVELDKELESIVSYLRFMGFSEPLDAVYHCAYLSQSAAHIRRVSWKLTANTLCLNDRHLTFK